MKQPQSSRVCNFRLLINSQYFTTFGSSLYRSSEFNLFDNTNSSCIICSTVLKPVQASALRVDWCCDKWIWVDVGGQVYLADSSLWQNANIPQHRQTAPPNIYQVVYNVEPKARREAENGRSFRPLSSSNRYKVYYCTCTKSCIIIARVISGKRAMRAV